MILESQLPATAFAVAAMITIATYPASPFIPWLIIVHPKIFIVGCLACVNSRHTWAREDKFQIPSWARSVGTPSTDTYGGPGTPVSGRAARWTSSETEAASRRASELDECGYELSRVPASGSQSLMSREDGSRAHDASASKTSLYEPDDKVKPVS